MASPKKIRDPQLSLMLGNLSRPVETPWQEGATLAYLGENLTLSLGQRDAEATLNNGVLYLPLPPNASPRQIQDAAEAWLREQAKVHLSQVVANKWALSGRSQAAHANAAPRLVLSFSNKGPWVEADGPATLRCRWRLIEQTPALIDQMLERALASLPGEAPMDDLFGFSFSNRAA